MLLFCRTPTLIWPNLSVDSANVTGVVLFAEEMNAKRVELLRALPGVSHLAAVTGAAGSATAANLSAVHEASRQVGTR